MTNRPKSAKPRLCLIYTGGTIGMVRDSGVLHPPDRPEDFLRVAPELDALVEFDFIEVENKDSTNIVPDDWAKIARAIHDRLDDDYDGFVVAHGTDTMHFSASAVAFALGGELDRPVVFTGAQTIPEVAHGDARVNLLRACRVAIEDLAEVVICFGEYVFRATRAQKKDERRFDAFESPALFPLAYVTEDILVSPLARRRPAVRIGTKLNLRPDFASGILQVSLVPGLEPELVMPSLENPQCRGLVLQSFGAGNVPDQPGFSFHKLIGRAVELDKPVLVTSQFPANATLHTAYAPGRAAIEAGAIPTGNMTASCAAAKFRWVLAQVDRAIDDGALRVSERIASVAERIGTVYVGEMDQD